MRAVDTLLGMGAMSNLVFRDLKNVEGTGKSSLFLFLCLYLQILAFFIMLVSISTLQPDKSKLAMQSLTDAFSSVRLSSEDTEDLNKESGKDPGQKFQEEITLIFESSLKAAKVDVILPGRVMLVTVPTDSIFVSGLAELRPIKENVLERLANVLAGRPEGRHHDLEFLQGAKLDKNKIFPLGRTLEIERANLFAVEMLQRGARSDSVAVGVEPGNINTVKFWFFTRNRDDLSIDFKPRLKKQSGSNK
jgi:hypothetical protein